MEATTRFGATAGVRWRAVLVLVLALMLLAASLTGCRDGSLLASEPTVQPATSAPAAANPTVRTAAPAAPGKPTAPPGAKPAAAVSVDREKIAREATWAPGQLQAHFAKHGREGPWASEAELDASARETIRIGTVFTYMDRESGVERLGFYHRESNRFASVTRDGGRITTHFKPDRGEAYVRALTRSSYR